MQRDAREPSCENVWRITSPRYRRVARSASRGVARYRQIGQAPKFSLRLRADAVHRAVAERLISERMRDGLEEGRA